MSIIKRLESFGIPLTILSTGLAVSLFGLDKLGITVSVAMTYFIIGIFIEGVSLIWLIMLALHFWKIRGRDTASVKEINPIKKFLNEIKFSKETIRDMFLSIILGLVIGALLICLYVFIILYTKSLISVYPVIVLIFFTILVVLVYNNKEFHKHSWRYIGIFLGFILTIQIVSPIFSPKVSILDNSIRFGSVSTINNTHISHVSGSVLIEIKPPLIPIDRDIMIPLAASNLTGIWYENIEPFVVSNVEPDKNFAKLYGFGDSWTYEKINIRLGYRGDTFPPHNARISDIQNPFRKYVTNTGLIQYIVPISLDNREDFQVCFQDYIFTISNETYKSQYSNLIKEGETDYSIFICDKTINVTQIVWERCGPRIHSSINGVDFSNVLEHEFLNAPQILLKTNSECVDTNSTRDNSYLVFEPLAQ